MFEFEPLYKKKKKEKEKFYLYIYLSIFFVLYGGTSGLHAHTHGHAWLGVVCCCWHVAVGCCTLLWYPVCLLVLANHRRRVAGCLANKWHCLLYSFWFFTNWWSQRHIWWNILDKSLVTGVLELFPWWSTLLPGDGASWNVELYPC